MISTLTTTTLTQNSQFKEMESKEPQLGTRNQQLEH